MCFLWNCTILLDQLIPALQIEKKLHSWHQQSVKLVLINNWILRPFQDNIYNNRLVRRGERYRTTPCCDGTDRWPQLKLNVEARFGELKSLEKSIIKIHRTSPLRTDGPTYHLFSSNILLMLIKMHSSWTWSVTASHIPMFHIKLSWILNYL